MRWMLPLLSCVLLICIGCNKHADKFAIVGNKVDHTEAPAGNRDFGKDKEAKADKDKEVKVDKDKEVKPQRDAEPAKKERAPAKPRKIRYTADLDMIVDNFQKSQDGLETAMKDAQAQLASDEIISSPGSLRSGTWRIRVPVDQLESFRTAITKLGEVERNTLQSEDITAQYYDLQADIKDRMVARETLRELLKETGKKEMKHYLDVWDKLESVSNEINRKEGQLRLWADLTELTTVTVHFREKRKFIPEEKAKDQEVATFRMQAGKTWSDSWDSVLGFGQWLILAAIALTPWLPIIVVTAGGIWIVARWLARNSAKPITVAAVKEPKDKKE